MDEGMTEEFHSAPEPFRSELREQMLEHMDEQVLASLDPDPVAVELTELDSGDPGGRRFGRVLVAAATVVLVGLGVLAALDRSGEDEPNEVISAQDTACSAFVAEAPLPEELSVDKGSFEGALAELETLLRDLQAELAAAGELGSAELAPLDLAIGGVSEAQLDRQAGDTAGARAALEFALAALNGSEALGVSYDDANGFGCG